MMPHNSRHWAYTARTAYVASTVAVVCGGFLIWSLYRRTGHVEPRFWIPLVLITVALFGVGNEATNQMWKARQRESNDDNRMPDQNDNGA